jgi:basic membrane lipoprotein Med (substrate-binding protein (PBP1-ABC) superfamily)
MQLTIQKKNYPIKFDFTFQDLLCEFYGFQRISELNKVFQQLDWSRGFTQAEIDAKTVDVSLCEPTREEIKVFGQVVYSGLQSANAKFSLSKGDVISALLSDEQQIIEVLKFLGKSLIKPTETADPKSRKK